MPTLPVLYQISSRYQTVKYEIIECTPGSNIWKRATESRTRDGVRIHSRQEIAEFSDLGKIRRRFIKWRVPEVNNFNYLLGCDSKLSSHRGFKVIHSVGHILGMVGPIGVKWKWSASYGHRVNYATSSLTLIMTFILDFSRSSFEIAVSQELLADWCETK